MMVAHSSGFVHRQLGNMVAPRKSQFRRGLSAAQQPVTPLPPLFGPSIPSCLTQLGDYIPTYT